MDKQTSTDNMRHADTNRGSATTATSPRQHRPLGTARRLRRVHQHITSKDATDTETLPLTNLLTA